MAITEATPSRFDWGIGTAIGTSFATVFRNVVPFVGLSLLIGTPRFLLARTGVPLWLTLVIDLVIGQIVTIILIYATVQSLRGRKAGIRECFGQGFSRLPAAIGVAVLSVIAYVLGLGLLIVPGLILASVWAVAIPVAVVENAGIGTSFARSASLTRDRRWRVFGTLALSWLIYAIAYVMVFAAVVVPLLGVTRGGRWWISLIPMWIVASILQAYLSALSGVLYYFLRRDKEGADIETIAAVFD
ncbi:MAG: hypothetical protein AB7O88_11185 [Reyranellaceae bacterium]